MYRVTDAPLMSPDFGPRAFAEVQARAFNAHDSETLASHSYRGARILRDGHLVGEGRKALQAHLEAEFRDRPLAFTRVLDLDGEPVLAEYTGDEGNEVVRGIISFKAFEGRVEELRIDHDEARLQRLR